jgi:Ca2+-binding EF-hand superfamily protein
MPEQWQQRFDRMDANGDEVIDEEEIEAMGNRGRGGQGSQRGRGGR